MAVKCPKCHFDNPEDSHFCGKRGTRIRGHEPNSPEFGIVSPNSKEVRSGITETLQTPVQELATGATFAGRYQIIEELGQGGMGRVYKVFDADTKEKIALKQKEGDTGLGYIKADPAWDRLHSDSRFKSLLRRMNL